MDFRTSPLHLPHGSEFNGRPGAEPRWNPKTVPLGVPLRAWLSRRPVVHDDCIRAIRPTVAPGARSGNQAGRVVRNLIEPLEGG